MDDWAALVMLKHLRKTLEGRGLEWSKIGETLAKIGKEDFHHTSLLLSHYTPQQKEEALSRSRHVME